MLPIILGLWLWLGYILGFVTLTITTQPAMAADSSSQSDSSTLLDQELHDKALAHAKTMSVSADREQHDQLLSLLREGDTEALYAVAQSLNSRNAGDDRVTSVLLWHALADGPAAHVPSAVALGFSYADVDKERALFYFVQASRGTEGDGPDQSALFNAGRIFLELNDAASALEYIRGCANLGRDYPAHATDQLTKACSDAYQALSNQIQSEAVSPPGIEEAAEIFLYASIKEFPASDTKEFASFAQSMEYLDTYDKEKSQTSLLAAQQELEQLQRLGEKKMSELQRYLLDIILGRIQFLMAAMESGPDEL